MGPGFSLETHSARLFFFFFSSIVDVSIHLFLKYVQKLIEFIDDFGRKRNGITVPRDGVE